MKSVENQKKFGVLKFNMPFKTNLKLTCSLNSKTKD